MKTVAFMLAFFFMANNVVAQSIERQLIGSGGESSIGTSITLNWVLGESFNSLQETSFGNMKEGLLQPENFMNDFDEPLLVPHEQASELLTALVYPNPFESTFNFYLNEVQEENLLLHLLDYKGTLIMTKELVAGTDQITWNMAHQPAGIYFLHIPGNSDRLNQVFKIVKHL